MITHTCCINTECVEFVGFTQRLMFAINEVCNKGVLSKKFIYFYDQF